MDSEGSLKEKINHIYQNVDLFKGTDDPFGDDFEESIKTAPIIPIKRASLNSSDSVKVISSPTNSSHSPFNSPIKDTGESIYNWPVWPPLPVKQVGRSNSHNNRHSTSSTPSGFFRRQPSFDQEDDTDSTYSLPAWPPLPAKQRVLSRLGRNSVSSSESERGIPSREHSRQHSYDEVTLSENFNKPVLSDSNKRCSTDSDLRYSNPRSSQISLSLSADERRELPGLPGRSADNISVLPGAIPGGEDDDQSWIQTPATNDSQDKNMNSLESTLSSASSIDQSVQNSNKSNDDNNIYNPYEDITEIRKNLHANQTSKVRKNLPPEPPPRNSILKPEAAPSLESKPVSDASSCAGDRPEVIENVYSDPIHLHDSQDETVMRTDNNNLFDRLMAEPVVQTSSVPLATHQLGAKPKIKTGTLDIRNTVYKWYEEAVQEAERDLSLDINHLDKNVSLQRRIGGRRQSYEPVYSTRDIQPSHTLLRAFDPCFDEVAEMSDEVEESVEDSDTDSDHNHQHTQIHQSKTNHVSKEKCDNVVDSATSLGVDSTTKFSEQSDDIDEIKARNKQVDKENNVKDFKESPNSSDTKKSTSIKFGSPKKFNFGPPKPPRQFEYSSLLTSAKDKLGKKDTKTTSPKELKMGKGKHKKETDNPDDESTVISENLYVTLPCDNNRRLSKSDEMASPRDKGLTPSPQPSSSSSPQPPPQPVSSSPQPPPLPVSAPPPAIKPKQTMYENVWIERISPDTETGKSKSMGSLHPDSDGVSTPSPVPGGVNTPSPPPPTLPPRTDRRGSHLSGYLNVKGESFGSQSSLATSGSNTSGSQHSKDLASNSENKDVKTALKKLSSGRSFSVGNLKLSRLPSMAENIKRKVADQLRSSQEPTTPTDQKSYPILSESYLEDTDDDDLGTSVAELSLYTGVGTTAGAGSVHSGVSVGGLTLAEWTSAGALGTKHFSGPVYVFSRRKKQFLLKWLNLGNGIIKWFNEESASAKPKEMLMLNNIFTISKKADKHMGPELQELHCFEIVAINSNGKLITSMIGCLSSTERNSLMEKTVQSLGSRLTNFDISDCTKIGWAYMKVGFAADWSLSWLYLTKTNISFATQQSDSFQTINLKKTKDVCVRKDCKSLEPPSGFTKHPVLVVDFNDRTVYILPGAPSEVSSWKTGIEQIAFTNTNCLSQQQVTHENVPVIVDKCLKFVFSHGVVTEGIYRLAGVNTKINKLLTEFRSNAWNVEICRDDYSEHDVANVLKRFVRQLEEPLLTDVLRQSFLTASRIKDQDTKLSTYKSLLGQLPDINHATIRKLLGHLYTVSSQSGKNLMPVYNLAPLWGPNMFIVDAHISQGFGETREETDVCADLISNYPYLFDVDMEELDKEKKLLEVLEKINCPTPSTLKRSGDVKMWCYLESRSAGECVSLTLHPSLTAGEAIKHVAKETGLNDIQGLVMHEVVLGECLERPIHYSEKLLDLTLSWGVWQDEDRRNNYLVLKYSRLYSEAIPCAIPPLSIFSEIQFCDNKPKSKFSKYLFSVANANITCYKEDKNGQTSESQSWPVEDITWYIGCEKKRNPPNALNLTFINKHDPVRTKETPAFGRVLSFSSRELFTKWIAALLVAQYGTDIQQNNLLLLE